MSSYKNDKKVVKMVTSGNEMMTQLRKRWLTKWYELLETRRFWFRARFMSGYLSEISLRIAIFRKKLKEKRWLETNKQFKHISNVAELVVYFQKDHIPWQLISGRYPGMDGLKVSGTILFCAGYCGAQFVTSTPLLRKAILPRQKSLLLKKATSLHHLNYFCWTKLTAVDKSRT